MQHRGYLLEVVMNFDRAWKIRQIGDPPLDLGMAWRGDDSSLANVIPFNCLAKFKDTVRGIISFP
jgi:hypothetical protein